MKALRHIAYLLLLFTTAAASGQAPTIVKEGVVNIEAVIRAFFMDSKQYRDQQAAADRVSHQVADFQREIAELQSQRLSAVEAKDTARVSQLDQLIREKTETLQYYRSTEVPRVEAMMASLVVNDKFLKNLLAAVAAIAEEDGFLTIRKFSDDFLYIAPEVDLTSKVIDKMRALQGSLP